MLEVDLLGASHAVQYSGIETTGQQVTTDINDDTTDWTTVGSNFD
jgi:hypothetical protein